VFFNVSPAISIRDIDRSIVFLMAEWSGPAQWAWRQLCDFVDGYGQGETIEATKEDLAAAIRLIMEDRREDEPGQWRS
jgi:hypothetical protein